MKNSNIKLENYTIELLYRGNFKTKGQNVFFAIDYLKQKLNLSAREMIITGAYLIKNKNEIVDVFEFIRCQ
jgi:uncharacterized protein with NAD-binding domain and iron-sulfur cluster